MAIPSRKRGRAYRPIWAASITAALSLGGSSAWAQSPQVLPAVPDLVSEQPPAAPMGPIIRAAAPDDAPAAPQDARTTAPAAPQEVFTVAPGVPAKPEAPDAPAISAFSMFAPGTGDPAPGFAVPSFSTQRVEGEGRSRLSDESIGIQPIPDRPPLIVETNDHFLSPGFLSTGLELPTGEIVRPSLWVFGNNQFGYNYFNNKTNPTIANELVDRLDLFTQLNLTATERFVWGVRPLDKERLNKRVYTRWDFERNRGPDGLNIDPETLFFEGDFGEIFPYLDLYDTKFIDYGFSVGRQPVLIQDGLLINANQLDAFTVTRTTLNGAENLNTRITGMFAWDRVHRNNDIYDPTALLYGLYTEADYAETTVDVDLVYVNAVGKTGSAFFAAASATQRIDGINNVWNSTFHVLTSQPTNQQDAATGRGELLFSQLSMTPHGRPDLLYIDSFWGIDNFSSAARNPEVGGPLGQTGILFASPASELSALR